MNSILFSIILLSIIIEHTFGRIVQFKVLTFGKSVSVTFNGKTYNMLPLDDYSNVYSHQCICPDEDIE